VPDDICASRFERVLINGVSITPGSLGKKLAETTNNTMIVELLNDGVSSQFTFQFEIASEEDLEGVDRCFIDVARRRRLDMRAIEDFIAAARRFPTAIGYCDGVCEYFYGVLAKEQANDSHIPYEAYLEKYTRAADVLKDFNRPLARSICALIEFHFNHFVECTKLAGNTRVGIAAGRFNRWIEGDTSGARNLLTQTFDDSFEKLFTDSETERLITWSVAEPQLSLLQLQDAESIVRQDIPELDRAKIRILLAESHTQYGHLEEAKRNARELRNNQTLGRWAERLLNQLSEKE